MKPISANFDFLGKEDAQLVRLGETYQLLTRTTKASGAAPTEEQVPAAAKPPAREEANATPAPAEASPVHIDPPPGYLSKAPDDKPNPTSHTTTTTSTSPAAGGAKIRLLPDLSVGRTFSSSGVRKLIPAAKGTTVVQTKDGNSVMMHGREICNLYLCDLTWSPRFTGRRRSKMASRSTFAA
jgi:hypothetical protein